MTDNNNSELINSLLSEYEQTIARLVLFSLTELPFPLGVKKTIDVLKGNKSAFTINHSLNKLYTFSVLPGYTRDQLSDMLDILINNGLIAVENVNLNEENYPVLKITAKGQDYLQGKLPTEFVLLDVLMDKDVPEIPEDDQDLYYKLKLTRRQLAEENDIPAFMVCSDMVLRSICIKKPTENEDLEKIKGVGPKFMENYSKQFLYVIRQWVTREKNV
ncbi:MAG: HRDC domain-containing protein [Bacteroidales bacterium]|nr:HRDC domain-containing protein [Bacteroidales bacterium]